MVKNTGKKLWAIVLAVVLLFTSLFGVLPMVVSASNSTQIGKITESKMLDEQYAYTFDSGSLTEVKLWGCSNSTAFGKKLDPNDEVDPNDRYYVPLPGDDKKDTFGVRYINVGEYKGKTIDLKISAMNWGSTYDWVSTYYNASTGQHENRTTGKPGIVFYRNRIAIGIMGINWARFKYTFVESGTDTPVVLDGAHFTLVDVDAGQQVRFYDGCKVDEAYILTGNDLLSIEDNIVTSKDKTETNDKDPNSWITGVFKGSKMGMDFFRAKGRVFDNNYLVYYQNENYRTRTDHYGFTADALGKFPIPDPEKYVGDTNEKIANIRDNRAQGKMTKKNPYEIPGEKGKGNFQYVIEQKLTPNELKQFKMEDTLKDCLSYVSMKIMRNEGIVDSEGNKLQKDVTKQFKISTSGQKVIATAISDYLSKDSFTSNHTYSFHITVKRKLTEAAEKLQEVSGEYCVVPNNAKTTIKYVDDDTAGGTTNTVWAGYKLSPIAPNDFEINKRIGDINSTWDATREYEYDKDDTAYRIHEYDNFDYILQAPFSMPDKLPTSLIITDTFEECVDIDNVSKIKITDKDGNLVTSKFDISISEDNIGKKTVTCKAKPESFDNPAFYGEGQCYYVHMTVHRKRTTDVATSMKEWMDDDGYTFYVPNMANVTVTDYLGNEIANQSNKSWFTDKIRSELKVEKTCIPYDAWEVGDEVEYAVKVTQTRQDGYAVNAEVWDTDLPDGLKLVAGSIKVTDTHLSDGTVATVKPEGTNGWRATCPRMQYGDYFIVSFKAKADDTVNGKDTINTAYATAENFTDENDEKKVVSDSAEVWINTPNLTIDKMVNRYEYEVGDTVKYTVNIQNTKDYTVAKNLLISDLSLPKGLELKPGAESVKVSYSPSAAKDAVGWPVADGTATIKTEAKDNVVTVTNNKNTWNLESKYLSSNDTITIQFECIATDDINGLETQNKASVVADNSAKDDNGNPIPSWDDAKIYVNTVDLTIDKSASKYEWEVGDDVQYKIVVSNNGSAKGTIARNVVIRDIDIPEGLVLEDINNVKVNGVPAQIVDKIAGKADTPNQLDEDEYNATETIENPCTINQSGTGFEIQLPNLPQEDEVVIEFPCKATVVADGNGWEWINKASVTASNQRGEGDDKTEWDDAEVYINTANLTMDKSMFNKYYVPDSEDYDNREPYEYRIGEEVEYKLTIGNTQRNSVARNVQIKDITLPKGFNLTGDIVVEGYNQKWYNPIAGIDDPTNKLNPEYYLEKEEKDFTFEVTPIVNEDGSNGFSIMIPDLPCTTGDELNPDWNTPLTVTYHAVATEEVNGYKIINTAKVSADNGLEKEDSETVWINSPVLDVAKNTDRKNYKIGDVINYNVVAVQKQIGCVARNVYFADVLLTEGVKLVKDSIVLLDENGRLIDDDDYQVEVYNDHFTLWSKRNLVCSDGNYPLSDLDKNGQIVEGEVYNPLGYNKENKMTIEYQAVAYEDSLAGQTVDNKITVNSDERIPDEDTTKVPINGPVINIEKTSDKEVYNVGETGIYKLVVTQLREDVTALNVTIEDELKVAGAVILPDTLQVEFNNKVFTPVNAAMNESNTGFVIQTGKDLTDADKLEVVYAVKFESPTLNGQKVNNVAVAYGTNTDREEQENIVLVKDPLPTLTIQKASDKTVYNVGETGHYSVLITQTEKDAVARNVLIKDVIQIEGANIVKDSIIVKNKNGKIMDNVEIQMSNDKYAIQTKEDLAYQEALAVEYDVIFESSALVDKEILNIARATCDNLVPGIVEDKPVDMGNGITAIKTAELASGSIVKNGGNIKYSITVTNISAKSMKYVLVKDKIPEYLVYVDSIKQDGVTADTIILGGDQYAIFVINGMAAGESRTVSFNTTVQNAPEDDVIINVAQVRPTDFDLEDMNEDTWNHSEFKYTNDTIHYLDTAWVTDDNIVNIKSDEPEGKLSFDKSVNKSQVNIGDVVTYTLVAKNDSNVDAKNVVFTDALDHEKAVIDADSIKVHVDGKAVDPLKVAVDGNKLIITTGMDLAAGQTMKVTYDLPISDKSLAGKTIKNTAVLTTDNNDPKEDEEKIVVNKESTDPKITIDKTANKKTVTIGDEVDYVITVKQTVKDAKAENMVIRDYFNKSGIDISDIKITLDGKTISGAKVTDITNGFEIATGVDLAYGEIMKVTYTGTFKATSLKNQKIKNVAIATSDNTEPVSANVEVPVKEKETTPTPTPTPSGSGTTTRTTGGGSSTTTTTGGKTATAAKTGDSRPLVAVGIIGLISVVALGGGVYLYKKGNKNKAKKK